jgi:hypothetical protein
MGIMIDINNYLEAKTHKTCQSDNLLMGPSSTGVVLVLSSRIRVSLHCIDRSGSLNAHPVSHLAMVIPRLVYMYPRGA